jgi:hypothetical protein
VFQVSGKGIIIVINKESLLREEQFPLYMALSLSL